MIIIEDKLIGDEIVEKQFVCDLSKCKGGCCEDGDAGAPLEESELPKIKDAYPYFEHLLTPEGKAAVQKQGHYTHDKEFGWVTPTITGGMCAYGIRDKSGVIKCGIEKAHTEGLLKGKLKRWQKPISCHLFPLRIKKTSKGYLLNYDPRPELCSPACILGKKLKVPVYQFLKAPLIRKFGKDFFKALHAAADHVNESR